MKSHESAFRSGYKAYDNSPSPIMNVSDKFPRVKEYWD